MQVFFILIIFTLFSLEGPPTFGMTPDSITIGDHTSVNDRVMDIQITDFVDFIKNIELDYDNEYFYFDTRLLRIESIYCNKMKNKQPHIV